MFNQKSQVSKLQKIAVGNFLWMLGLMLCVQAFLQVKDPHNLIGISSFEWWIALHSLTFLSASEFSFFIATIAFAASSLTHLGFLLVYLFFSKMSVGEVGVSI